jgi:hypothetical protein
MESFHRQKSQIRIKTLNTSSVFMTRPSLEHALIYESTHMEVIFPRANTQPPTPVNVFMNKKCPSALEAGKNEKYNKSKERKSRSGRRRQNG